MNICDKYENVRYEDYEEDVNNFVDSLLILYLREFRIIIIKIEGVLP